MRRARSRSVMAPRIEAVERRSDSRKRARPGLRRGLSGGPRPAGLKALVTVSLDLPRELVRDQVDRVLDVAGRVRRAQRDPLEVQRRLGDPPLRIGGVLLRGELDLEDGQLGDLLA